MKVWDFLISFLLSTLLAAEIQSERLPLWKISGLYRHAVKGLSADSLQQVVLQTSFETFPDDRRFALLKQNPKTSTSPSPSPSQTAIFVPESPQWLHKENFLCAFSNPQLMAQFQASYSIHVPDPSKESYALPCDCMSSQPDGEGNFLKRCLLLRERSTNQLVLGPVDLETMEGRAALANFFSRRANGLNLACVTASTSASQKHIHQFGNTSSGWKRNKDTRTVHIINSETVQQFAQRIRHQPLHPTRFRPNIIVTGPEPWSEFDWIGKKLQFGTMTLEVISKTVRCEGVSIDPLDPASVLDIPKLLLQHFPDRGPYLGVYAVVRKAGNMALGDEVKMLD